MRPILLTTLLCLTACQAQRADTQRAAPEPLVQPAAGPGTVQPSAEANEAEDDADTAAQRELELRENSLARFRAEPVDSAWATPTRSALQSLLDQAGGSFPTTVKVGTVECRQKTCLLEIVHPDEHTFLPTRKVLARQVYLVVKQQGHDCVMAQHGWPNPDGSMTERVYFEYQR
ncbi:MAG: hypothetical protein KF718_01305 [Polyangiaceae bacterium]|nr:hypothetical protein [Polyangiaceae bacterium]